MVRSAKEKHFDELNSIVKLIRNHRKIKDMSKLLTSFEDLTKAYAKAKSSFIDKTEGGRPPAFYIRCLADIEDCINENWEDRKNMNKNNSKSMTTLRQKLRKYNKDFEELIQEYRANPDAVEDEEEFDVNVAAAEESDSSSSSDESLKRRSLSKRKSIQSDESLKVDADSDDSIDWDMSSDDSSSSSDDEDYGGNLAAKFLKKDTDKDKDKTKKREKKVKEGRKKKLPDEVSMDGEWQTVDSGVPPSEKPKMFSKDAEVNVEIMVKKLFEIKVSQQVFQVLC